MSLEKQDISLLGQPVLHHVTCPGWWFIKVSISAVFTTGAEVEHDSKICNRYEVLFLTLG